MKTALGTVILLLATALLVPQSAGAWTDTRNFDSNDPWGSQSTLVTSPAKSGKAVQFLLPQGSASGVGIHCFVLPSRINEGQEFWARYYLYPEAGFSWNCDPVVKLLRFEVSDGAGKHHGYISFFNGSDGNGKLCLSVESAGFQKTQNLNMGHSSALTGGRWHCLELYVRLSSESDGIARMWHDGVLVMEYKQPNISAGCFIIQKNSDTVQGQCHHFWGYWNGGVPKTQAATVDEFIVTTDQPSNQDKEGNRMIGLLGQSSALPVFKLVQAATFPGPANAATFLRDIAGRQISFSRSNTSLAGKKRVWLPAFRILE